MIDGSAGPYLKPELDDDMWGLCATERIDAEICAETNGTEWKACLTSLAGVWSIRTRLLDGCDEVTGPQTGGNTTENNYCEQLGSLKATTAAAEDWYMISAVDAHEMVHHAHLLPALKKAAPQIAARFAELSTPDTGQGQAAAIAEIKSSGHYTHARVDSRILWGQEYEMESKDDHHDENNVYGKGPAFRAEAIKTFLMMTNICTHAENNIWIPCSVCQIISNNPEE